MTSSDNWETSPAKSLRQLAYDRIREGILSLELKPGEPLSENRLAQKLQISRTPVREALKQLERDGLLRFAPPKGAFVTELRSQDILEIYQVRESLEGLAARLAAEQMSDADIATLDEELNERYRQVKSDAWRDTFHDDRHLHEQIIKAAGNRRLAQFLTLLHDHMYRIWHLSPPEPDRLQITLDEHRAIIDALKARDGEAAAAAMVGHLRTARGRALRLVATRRTSE